MLDIQRHGGWKSSTVAEGYIEESIGNKIKINNMIASTIYDDSSIENTKENHKTESLKNDNVTQDAGVVLKRKNNLRLDEISNKSFKVDLSHCSNVTINFLQKDT